MTYTRKAINEVLSGKIYQRGQILTWPLQDKFDLMNELNIRIVVNFWSKLDPDLSDSPVELYMYMPKRRSIGMLDKDVELAAKMVADMIREKDCAVLILCEAGKTRSVFFTILVVKYWFSIPIRAAYTYVNNIITKHSLKDFMIKYIEEGGAW